MSLKTLGICVLVVWGAQATPLTDAPQSPRATRRDRPILHDRAAARGSFLDEVLDPGDAPTSTLAELVARTPIVVVGRTLGVRSRLNADERDLTTEVAFRVQDSVKGTMPAGSVIYFRAPGGSYGFGTGLVARQRVQGFRAVRPNTMYAVFLRELPVGTGNAPRQNQREVAPYRARYELAMGQQGQFELDQSDGTVIPAPLGQDHPLAVRYANMTVREFLTELHRVALQ
jgi:hypothetical protein